MQINEMSVLICCTSTKRFWFCYFRL